MYLTHHYLIDLVAGGCLATFCFYFLMPEELKEWESGGVGRLEEYDLVDRTFLSLSFLRLEGANGVRIKTDPPRFALSCAGLHSSTTVCPTDPRNVPDSLAADEDDEHDSLDAEIRKLEEGSTPAGPSTTGSGSNHRPSSSMSSSNKHSKTLSPPSTSLQFASMSMGGGLGPASAPVSRPSSRNERRQTSDV